MTDELAADVLADWYNVRDVVELTPHSSQRLMVGPSRVGQVNSRCKGFGLFFLVAPRGPRTCTLLASPRLCNLAKTAIAVAADRRLSPRQQEPTERCYIVAAIGTEENEHDNGRTRRAAILANGSVIVQAYDDGSSFEDVPL